MNEPAEIRLRRPVWPFVLGGCLGVTCLLGMCLAGASVFGLLQIASRFVPDHPGFVANDPAVKQTTAQFNSGGSLVALDLFEPIAEGKYPVVLVVHGFDGLEYAPWRHYYEGQCQELARNGYVALLVHYFDRTGTTIADLPKAKQHAQPWVFTLLDAMSYAAQLPHADGQKVGVVGTSLGAVLGVSLASFDPRIGAIVQISGVMPEEIQSKMKRLPPLLILHGGSDRQLPAARIQAMARALEKRKFAHELHIYPAQGHYFKGSDATDALNRTVHFLDKHLKQK